MRDLEEWRLAVLTGSTKAGYGGYIASKIKKAAGDGLTCVIELHPSTILSLLSLNDKGPDGIAKFREELLDNVTEIK